MSKTRKPKREGVLPVARLRYLMDEQGVSQSDIARRAGVGRSTVSAWLHPEPTERTKPGPDGVAAFAVLLGIPAGFVVGAIPEPASGVVN